jgi:hypothetical protein
MKLTFHPNNCDWLVFPVEGEAFTDSGRGRCHRHKFTPLYLPRQGGAVPPETPENSELG